MFIDFIAIVNPTLLRFRHVRLMADVLQTVVDGDRDRLFGFEPPRHFKSELVSRLLPAYYLTLFPDRWVGLSSYSANLAYTLSRNARDYYVQAGGQLSKSGAEQWATDRGGGMWAAGVGGSITGMGFSLGLVDDPVKNSEEAASETIRAKHKEWWRSTFYTRQSPHAAICVIQTRWHEDDLSGWLLSQEGDEDNDPERWHIVNMPAIMPEEPIAFPSTCTVEPDPREPGEALSPERYPVEKLQRIKRAVGSYFYGALYDQNPAPLEGGILKRQWWRYWQPAGANLPPVSMRLANGDMVEIPAIDLPATFDEMLQSWDLAFKDADTSDFAAGQVWARSGASKYLLDYILRRVDVTAIVESIKAWSHEWPDAVAKLIEDKANGPAVIQMLRGQTSGVIAVNPEGNKLSRVYAVQPEIESGDVYLPHPRLYSWVDGFVTNCASFPNAAHDDDVDAMSQALVRMRKGHVESAPTIWR